MSGDGFTEREHTVMALAWQCFTEQPKIDFDKLAGLAGYTNVRSASNAWAGIKKKLVAQAAKAGAGGPDAEGDADADGDGTAATAKPTPKKRGRANNTAGEDGGEENGTPAVKKTKGRKGKAIPKKASSDATDGDTEAPVKAEGEGGDDYVV